MDSDFYLLGYSIGLFLSRILTKLLGDMKSE